MTPTVLKRAMAAEGLTVVRFAELLGVTPGAVQAWRTGRRPVPGHVMLVLTLLGMLPQRARRAILGGHRPIAGHTGTPAG